MYEMRIELPEKFTFNDMNGVVNWLDDNIGLGSKKLMNSEFDEKIHAWKGIRIAEQKKRMFLFIGLVKKEDMVTVKLKYGAESV